MAYTFKDYEKSDLSKIGKISEVLSNCMFLLAFGEVFYFAESWNPHKRILPLILVFVFICVGWALHAINLLTDQVAIALMHHITD
jgi:hypothetical protein